MYWATYFSGGTLEIVVFVFESIALIYFLKLAATISNMDWLVFVICDISRTGSCFFLVLLHANFEPLLHWSAYIRVCPLPPLVSMWDTDLNHLIHLCTKQVQSKVKSFGDQFWGLDPTTPHILFLHATPCWGQQSCPPQGKLGYSLPFCCAGGTDRGTSSARGPWEAGAITPFCSPVDQVAAQNYRNKMQSRYKKEAVTSRISHLPVLRLKSVKEGHISPRI